MTEQQAARIYEFSQKHGLETTVNAFPEYSEAKIKRAISDHVDRIILSHRSRKQVFIDNQLYA